MVQIGSMPALQRDRKNAFRLTTGDKAFT
jgi:hypothetical protein